MVNNPDTTIIESEIESGLSGKWTLNHLDAIPKADTFHLYKDVNERGKLMLVLRSRRRL